MGKPDPATTVVSELRLLLRSYPQVSLAELASALQGAPPTGAAAAAGDGSWEQQIEPILHCAAAFGDSRLFASKREALRILSEELGIPSTWSNLTWSQLPSIAAAALLRQGPARAVEIATRYRFGQPRLAAPRAPSASDATVDATLGIMHAKHT